MDRRRHLIVGPFIFPIQFPVLFLSALAFVLLAGGAPGVGQDVGHEPRNRTRAGGDFQG
jgi:hypothetical protein